MPVKSILNRLRKKLYHHPMRGAVAKRDASKSNWPIRGCAPAGTASGVDRVLYAANKIAAITTMLETDPRKMPNAR